MSRLETKGIPADCDKAVEDDAELLWYVLVIYPPNNRPELHFFHLSKFYDN